MIRIGIKRRLSSFGQSIATPLIIIFFLTSCAVADGVAHVVKQTNNAIATISPPPSQSPCGLPDSSASSSQSPCPPSSPSSSPYSPVTSNANMGPTPCFTPNPANPNPPTPCFDPASSSIAEDPQVFDPPQTVETSNAMVSSTPAYSTQAYSTQAYSTPASMPAETSSTAPVTVSSLPPPPSETVSQPMMNSTKLTKSSLPPQARSTLSSQKIRSSSPNSNNVPAAGTAGAAAGGAALTEQAVQAPLPEADSCRQGDGSSPTK